MHRSELPTLADGQSCRDADCFWPREGEGRLDFVEMRSGVESDAFGFGNQNATRLPRCIAQFKLKPDRAIGELLEVGIVVGNPQLAVGKDASAAAATGRANQIGVQAYAVVFVVRQGGIVGACAFRISLVKAVDDEVGYAL